MAPDRADLQAAIAEALEESEFPTEEKVAAESWEEWEREEASAPAADDGSEPSKAEPTNVETEAEGDEPQLEVPDEYWGVSLEGIPAEQAKAILDKLQQQDSYIQKLQTRLASEPAEEQQAPPPADEPEEEVTDEALLQALGFDPDDWETQQLAPRILPLARTVLSLEDKVAAMEQKDTIREVQTQWNSSLDELESTYGKLPVDRVSVLRYAVEEGIASPFETYFRIKAPVEREVKTAVNEARRAAARKAETGGVKPRNAAVAEASIDPKTTSLRDATAIAMKQAEKETGLSFKNLFGRKVPVEE